MPKLPNLPGKDVAEECAQMVEDFMALNPEHDNLDAEAVCDLIAASIRQRFRFGSVMSFCPALSKPATADPVCCCGDPVEVIQPAVWH